MSDENRSDRKLGEEIRVPTKRSYDSIPPQTGEFRNRFDIFERIPNLQTRESADSQPQTREESVRQIKSSAAPGKRD